MAEPIDRAALTGDQETYNQDVRWGRILTHAVIEAVCWAFDHDLEPEDGPAAPSGPSLRDCGDTELQALCRQREQDCDAAEAAFNQARAAAAKAIEEIARRGIAAEQRYRQAAESSGDVMPIVEEHLLDLVRQECGLTNLRGSYSALPSLPGGGHCADPIALCLKYPDRAQLLQDIARFILSGQLFQWVKITSDSMEFKVDCSCDPQRQPEGEE